ncbi:MAG: zinc carboxypeptidase, partial [Ferruginibacter sp.]
DANSGNVGTYKTYVIKNNPGDEGKVRALLQLLDKNGIEYGTASGSAKGFNYHNRKEESFSFSTNDIVVTVAQPRGVMVNVLFEPSSTLVDSATYDITAWSLPYAYGLNAYACTQRISISPKKTVVITNNLTTDAYGYVIRWEATNSAATAAQLLEKGIKLRISETAFEANNESFGRGSIIILKKGNEQFGADLWKEASSVCNSNHSKMYAVKSGMVDKGFDFGSYYVHPIKAPRVVLLTGENVNSNAAGEVWNFFDNVLKYKITLVNVNNFDRIIWSDFDVIIMPDGRYRFLSDKSNSEKLEKWIRSGGRVVAMESAVEQLSKMEWSNIKSKNGSDEDSNSKKDAYRLLRTYSERERASIAEFTPGAIFKVDVDNTHPLMFGYPSHYYTLKMDNAVYEFIKDGGWNAGVIKKENQLDGFVGHKLSPKLKDGLLFGVQHLDKG